MATGKYKFTAAFSVAIFLQASDAFCSKISKKPLCSYSEEKDEYICSRDATEHGRVSTEQKFTKIGDGRIVANFSMLYKDDLEDCPVAIEVILSHPSADILVDWKKVSVAVNDRAIQFAPSRVKNTAASQGLEPSIALAATALREELFPDDSECIISKKRSSQLDEESVFVVIPIEIGNSPSEIAWQWKRKAHAISELEAMKLTPRPAVLARPNNLIVDADGEPFPALFSTIGGGFCLVTNLFYSSVQMLFSATPYLLQQSTLVRQVACFIPLAFAGIGCALLPFCIGGDIVRNLLYAYDRTMTDDYNFSLKRRLAYDRKMSALELKEMNLKMESTSIPASLPTSVCE